LGTGPIDPTWGSRPPPGWAERESLTKRLSNVTAEIANPLIKRFLLIISSPREGVQRPAARETTEAVRTLPNGAPERQVTMRR
jgi:hypothetical protein